MGLWHDARVCKVQGVMGVDRARNEDICESRTVAVVDVKEREK